MGINWAPRKGSEKKTWGGQKTKSKKEKYVTAEWGKKSPKQKIGQNISSGRGVLELRT